MARYDERPASAMPAMCDPRIARVVRPIGGLRLRELLVLILLRHATPMTVAGLVAAMAERGFCIQGRPGKVVSDQLRFELARGRVCRVARGVYVAGAVTRQARWRMQRRSTALAAATCSTTEETLVAVRCDGEPPKRPVRRTVRDDERTPRGDARRLRHGIRIGGNVV